MTDLQQSIEKLETEIARLNSQMAESDKVTATVADVRVALDKLGSQVTTLGTQVAVKDDTLRAISDVNKTLVGQFNSRFSLPQVLMSFLSFCFAVTFGYQLWKADEIRKATSDVLRISHELEQGAHIQAEVLASIVTALTLTNQGYYVLGRRQFARASDFGARALAILEGTQKRVSEEGRTTASKRDEKSEAHLRAQDLVRPLEESLQEATLLSQNLNAQAAWNLKQYRSAWAIGTWMIEKAPQRWEGYHYRGLAALASPELGGNPESDLAQSLAFNPRNNPDILNLIEYSFVRRNFKGSRDRARNYLQSDPQAPATWRFVCDFFGVVSAYVISDEIGAQKDLEAFTGHDVSVPSGLGNDYTTETLEGFLDADGGFNELPEPKRPLVSSALKWMIVKAGSER